MFINSKNMEHYAWTLGLTRMVSAVFRRSADVSFVAEELKAVFDPRGGAWMQGRYVPSLLAAIGDIVERHLRKLGCGRKGRARDGLRASVRAIRLSAVRRGEAGQDRGLQQLPRLRLFEMRLSYQTAVTCFAVDLGK